MRKKLRFNNHKNQHSDKHFNQNKQIIYRLPLSLLLFLILLPCSCYSTSGSEPKTKITITGKIFVTGNEPHTFTAIRTKTDGIEETYEIIGPKEKKIREKMQGRIITVTGTVERAPSDPLLKAICVKKIK